MEVVKILASVVGGAAVMTAFLGAAVKVIQAIQAKGMMASASKALVSKPFAQ